MVALTGGTKHDEACKPEPTSILPAAYTTHARDHSPARRGYQPNWGSEDADDDSRGETCVIRQAIEFFAGTGDEPISVARGGMLRSKIVRELGFDPDAVQCGHVGIGLERTVLPSLGLRLEDVAKLWHPPHLPAE